ncbi:APC family permease [Streptomyces monticola]|uniref:APC family permease n=1 Tax=Streptomyces monticola TaxID=2666263 RepID=A0ABW2JFR4_9ACTN
MGRTTVKGGGLGVGAGAALCVGAVLGPGALSLASAAAAVAGPASLLAWSVLIAASLPIALAFAALGARHPDGGGVATFVRKAFGARTAAPVGWWFYWAVPLGVPAAALIGGEYVASALGLGRAAVPVIALVVLAGAYTANLAGLRLSGGLQLLLLGLLALLLCVAVAVAGAHVETEHFTPFLPHGWASVGGAASVLFFAFAGWEAVSHLSAEFTAPRRDLPRATLRAWIVVAVLYAGLAVVTIGVLGAAAGDTTTPLTLLLERGIGPAAHPVAAAAALLLTFGAVNAYLAGGARLGAALGRDGDMPRRLTVDRAGSDRAGGDQAAAAPRRSLTLLAAVSTAVTALAAAGAVDLATLMRATSACLAAVTLAGLLAATVLLPRRGPLRAGAAVGAALVAVVLCFCGPFLLLPAVLGAAAWGLSRLRRGYRVPSAAPTAQESPLPAASATTSGDV